MMEMEEKREGLPGTGLPAGRPAGTGAVHKWPGQDVGVWPAIADKAALEAALAPERARRMLRKVDTPMKAYQSEAPTLATISKEHGEGFCKNRLYVMLMSLGEYMGNQYDLSMKQVALLAEEILDDFYALNVADVFVVLKRIMHGDCGKIYGKISCAYIYEAFRSYYQERSDAVAESHKASEESIAKHGYDRTTAPTATEEQVADLYKQYRKTYEAKLERDELLAITAQNHLKEVLTTFNNWKNGKKEDM